MPGSRRALIVVIAAALGGTLAAPAAAQVSERCLGTPTLCETTFSMAGGASNKQITVRLPGTNLRLLSVNATPGFVHGAYILSRRRFSQAGSVFTATLDAVQGMPPERPPDPDVRPSLHRPVLRQHPPGRLLHHDRADRLAQPRVFHVQPGEGSRPQMAGAVQGPPQRAELHRDRHQVELPTRPGGAAEPGVHRGQLRRPLLRPNRDLDGVAQPVGPEALGAGSGSLGTRAEF